MVDRYQKIYDKLKEEILILQKELDALNAEEELIMQDKKKRDDELSLIRKIQKDLEMKASLIKPKELDEDYMNVKRGKLYKCILLLFLLIYSLITLMILSVSLLIIPSALMVLLVIGVSGTVASIFGDKVVRKVVSKIIDGKIEKVKNTAEGKEYLEIRNQIKELFKEFNSKDNTTRRQNMLSQLSYKKKNITAKISEIENFINSLEELERKYVLESDVELDDKNIKKKTLRNNHTNSRNID